MTTDAIRKLEATLRDFVEAQERRERNEARVRALAEIGITLSPDDIGGEA